MRPLRLEVHASAVAHGTHEWYTLGIEQICGISRAGPKVLLANPRLWAVCMSKGEGTYINRMSS